MKIPQYKAQEIRGLLADAIVISLLGASLIGSMIFLLMRGVPEGREWFGFAGIGTGFIALIAAAYCYWEHRRKKKMPRHL